MKRRHEIPLLFAMFLDLVGFGMALPDVQLRAEAFGAKGWLIGAILSSMFLTQVLVSPLWGKLSDRIGRKPVLLMCGTLSTLSMLTYALSWNLWGILASRIFAGFAAANVVVGQAYIADVTEGDVRIAAMGRVGGAIQAGLIMGPAIGGFLTVQGGNRLLGFCAAIAAALSVVWIFFSIPNNKPVGSAETGRKPTFDFSILRDIAPLRRLFVIAAAGWFALACLEGTFGRLIAVLFGYSPQQVANGLATRDFGVLFSYESLLGVAIQGFLLAYIAKRLSERTLLRLGYIMQGIGLAMTPFAPHYALLFMVTTIYAIGAGISSPTVNAACSKLTPPDRQGELFGLLQSSRSLGFLLGPILGGALFDLYPAAPYWLAGLVSFSAALLVAIPSGVGKNIQGLDHTAG